MKNPKYVYGFDPAKGEDHSASACFKVKEDGSLELAAISIDGRYSREGTEQKK